ncbi:two-component regulator propeller domain-containing protein [Flavobacterium sp. DG1-102-2]|uniref:two-component regulator propeller domain-containing protein n=1 Tax=Flavobacterium sp. DG1-102-2 TaxID=3081663 RepID=UPI00294A3BA4|nr:two-component regulator propeller domain-containing protein [Flavobacterium sp. DG1-102-2]MDV6170251.1 two-component regulator propeller domain-containing protein [Flavobacterium sp. DG1-102-2]
MTSSNYFYNSLFVLLFITLTGYSQDKYHLTWYSADSNHLPQNSVKSITPDKHGFIWLSTENGVVRYDGQNFKNYNSENVKNILANRMMFFFGNKQKDSIFIFNEKKETLLINKRNVYNREIDLYTNLN